MRFMSVRKGGRFDRSVCEGLENRVVLTASHDLAVVGLTFDNVDGFSAYMAELDWRSDRSVTGDLYVPSDSGPQGPSPTPIADLINGAAGSSRALMLNGDYDTRFGARFIPDEGYSLGWLGGAMNDGSSAELAAVVERSDDAVASDLFGTWVLQFTQVKGSNVYTRHGTLSLNSTGGFFSLALGAFNDPPFTGEGFEYSGTPDNGRLDFDFGAGGSGTFYVSKDKSILLVADLDTSDGDMWMGYAMRQDVGATVEGVAGSYRIGVLADGDATVQLLDGPAAAWQVDLAADGTYQALGLADVDAGDSGSVISTGIWTLDNGLVTLLEADSGLDIGLKISDNGSTAQLIQFRVVADNVFERPMGIATRVMPDTAVGQDSILISGVFDAMGEPRVYDLRTGSDSWSVVDVDRYALGAQLGASPADIEAWKASDGRLLAAITTDDGLFVAERDAGGFWRGSNLTSGISGAENITSTITAFTDKVGKSYVAGVVESGEVVVYVFDPTAQNGDGQWSYVNLSDSQLTPKNETTPVFVGPLMSYVTSWNGLNIVGLDASGKLQAVWTGDGGKIWHSANLSNLTGAPTLASGLGSRLTPWGGISIDGLNPAGETISVWWNPSLQQQGKGWQVANITQIAGGPKLVSSTITSFITPWGGLNIAGLNAAGDMIAYWWSPALPKQGKSWQVANLTTSIPDSDPKPSEQLQSQANSTHGGEMNILGTDQTTGDLIRLYFRVDANQWRVQNVTDAAAFA